MIADRTSIVSIDLADSRAAELPELLAPGGGVLLRNTDVRRAEELSDVVSGLDLRPVDWHEPFTFRNDLGAGVWSELAWPSNAPMCMHNELGWEREPPPYLVVCCLRQPDSGGRTGVADGTLVLSRLPPDLLERATAHGWSLTRRYVPGLVGMAWEEAFAGFEEADVEAYAADEGIELTWGHDSLVTVRHRPAMRAGSSLSELAWSNLLAFCSEWTLDPGVRAFILSTIGRDALPFETSYGDGSPFGESDVEIVNAAYDGVTAYVEWAVGDILVLDNIRTAHSVEPYTGLRQMAVVHAGPSNK